MMMMTLFAVSVPEESCSSLAESSDAYSLWLWPGCNHRPNAPLGPGQVLPSSIGLNPLSANGNLCCSWHCVKKSAAVSLPRLKPRPCQPATVSKKHCRCNRQLCRSPVHSSNSVQPTLSNATSWTILSTMSNQQATLSKQRSTLSKQHSTLLPQTATMSNEYVKCRPLDKVDCCFDIVAVFGNNVAGFGNNVERNFVLSTKSKQ